MTVMSEQDTGATLQALILIGRQAEAGLHRLAAAVRAVELRGVVLRRAREHAAASDELQRQLDWLRGAATVDGVTPPPEPAAGAAAPSDDQALLAECERIEGRAVDAWRSALDGPLPSWLRPVLHEQDATLRRSRRRIQVLLHLARHGDLMLPLDATPRAAQAPTELPSPLDMPVPREPPPAARRPSA